MEIFSVMVVNFSEMGLLNKLRMYNYFYAISGIGDENLYNVVY